MSRHRSFATSEGVRRRMQQQGRRDTRPEIALRRELHRRGLRYRLCERPIPELRRNIDVVLRPLRIAIEIRGCFWHHCPQHGTIPKSNSDWWRQKFARTQARDNETERLLQDAGWVLLWVWEHENPVEVAAVVRAMVDARRTLPNVGQAGHAGGAPCFSDKKPQIAAETEDKQEVGIDGISCSQTHPPLGISRNC